MNDVLTFDDLRRQGALAEREAVVAWLRSTADTAAMMWPGDDERSSEIRRHLVGTLLVNADAIERGDHLNPRSGSHGEE